MKKLFLILVLLATSMTSILALGNDTLSSGLLLAGNRVHCDSIRLPEDSVILNENMLLRYMTPGMQQAVITKEEEQDFLFFRILPFSNSSKGIDYDPLEATACLELDTRLPAGDLPDLDPPVITGLYPLPGATEISVRTSLCLITSEPVKKDSGMIRLMVNDSLYAVVNILSQAVSISNDTVNVRLPVLLRNKPFQVFMDSTCLSDLNNNHLTWGNNSWYFHTITGELYFSEYIEGESYLKAIELFNPTTRTISLDNYRIHYSRNGAGLASIYSFPQGRQLPPGQVFVVVHQSVVDLDTFDLPAGCQADILTGGIVLFNGNDALGLEKTSDNGASWELIDLFGDPLSINNFDVAGIIGAAKDHSLLRKTFVRFGNNNWVTSAGSNRFSSEWKVYPINYLSNLGYPSPACDSSVRISSYTFPGLTDSVKIFNDSSMIYVYLKQDIQADSLIPQMVIPEFASIDPSGGTPVPFGSGQVKYTVTAEDRTHIRIWTIVLRYPESEPFSTLRELKSSGQGSQSVRYSGTAMITAVKDSLAFIQDSTAGVMVMGPSSLMTGFTIGNKLIEFSGQLVNHQGITGINLLDEPVIIYGDAVMVYPVALLIQDILAGSDLYESVLVQIRNGRFTAPGMSFAAGQEYHLNQGTDTVPVNIGFFDTGLEGSIVPAFATVTGILMKTDQDLYLSPRFLADIEVQTSDFEFNPADALLIVPNPGPGIFTISGHQMSGPARINVFNLAGQKIYESELTEIESVDLVVNIQVQPAGTYVMFMTVLEKIYVCLLVKTE
jgi:hypothetical protein